MEATIRIDTTEGTNHCFKFFSGEDEVYRLWCIDGSWFGGPVEYGLIRSLKGPEDRHTTEFGSTMTEILQTEILQDKGMDK